MTGWVFLRQRDIACNENDIENCPRTFHLLRPNDRATLIGFSKGMGNLNDLNSHRHHHRHHHRRYILPFVLEKLKKINFTTNFFTSTVTIDRRLRDQICKKKKKRKEDNGKIVENRRLDVNAIRTRARLTREARRSFVFNRSEYNDLSKRETK